MKIILPLIVCALLSSHPLLLAQWTNDPGVNTPVSVAQGGQYDPAIVTDGAGGAIIAWTDKRNPSTGSDIYAQRLDAQGFARWNKNGVSVCSAPGDQFYPSAISDGVGGVIILWSDFRNPQNAPFIYVQRIDSSGNTMWTSGGVLTSNAPVPKYYASLTGDGASGAIITWYDNRNGNADIFAQHVDASGSATWTGSGITVCSASGDQFPANGKAVPQPPIIADGAGGAIIMWRDNSNTALYAQHINVSGAGQWASAGAVIARTNAASLSFQEMINDGSGGAYITWQNWLNVNDVDVYAQHIDGSGQVLWSDTGYALAAGSAYDCLPLIAPDGAGGAIITWNHKDPTDPGVQRIFAQRLDGSGVPQWSAGGVDIGSALGWGDYQIAPDGLGGLFAVWNSDILDGQTNDVFGQHVDATGRPTWPGDGVPVSLAAGNQTGPNLVADGAGNAIVAWSDERKSQDDADVYAKHLMTIPAFQGYRTFSPQGIAFARDQRGRIGVAVKPNKGMPNEINVLEEVFRQGIFPNNPVGDGLGGMVIGLSYLRTNNGKLQVDPAMAKTHGWMRLGRWDQRSMKGTRQQDVLKTLSTRGIVQNGPARGFEFVHERNSMPPAKYNNVLMAEQIALKLNILVSACGMAKQGLGELRYVEAGNTCTGMIVRDIAGRIDSALTLRNLSWNYADLLMVAQKINRAFEGPMDVINSAYPVRLAVKGVHEISDVPILAEDATVKPRILPPRVGSDINAPAGFELLQNYPNPFNPTTTVEFNLPDQSIVTMKVYNVLGEEIRTLLDQEEMTDGMQSVEFDATGYPSGLYFYRIIAVAIDENRRQLQTYESAKKMILLK